MNAALAVAGEVIGALLGLALIAQLVVRFFADRSGWRRRVEKHLDFVDTLVIVILEDSGDRRNHNLAQELRERREEWRRSA